MGRTITHKVLAAIIIVAVSFAVAHARTAVPIESARSVSPCANPDEPNLDPPVDWPTRYAVSQTGEINASFDAYGTFGLNLNSYGLECSWPRVSFETPPGSKKEYLFLGAIWVGGIVDGDTLVTVGHDGWLGDTEIFPATGRGDRTVTKLENMSDFSARAVSTDTFAVYGDIEDHTPLNLRIVNQSHSWQTDPYDGAIVYDMVITNIGDQFIEKGYVSIFLDADAHQTPSIDPGWLDDLTGSIRDRGIAYVIDDDGEPVAGAYTNEESVQKAIAFKFLYTSFEATDTSYNWWSPNGNPANDFGPQLKSNLRILSGGGVGHPAVDADKYWFMSQGEWDYDQVRTAQMFDDDTLWYKPNLNLIPDFGEFDSRFLMSIGPFDLPPDSSVRIQYTMFTADSIHTDPENFTNHGWQNYDPDAYLAGLNLERLYPIEQAATEKAAALREPNNPPTGLTLVSQDASSVTVAWDPWVLEGLDGYDLFLTPIDPRDLPHQGIIPSWWRTDEPQYSISIAVASQTTIDIPDSTIPYLVQARHRTGGGCGTISLPLILYPYNRLQPPIFPREYEFVDEEGALTLEWTAPDEAVDHFNLYHIPAVHPHGAIHEPFYSFNRESGPSGPADSIWQDGYWRYYFAMEIDSQLTGDARSLQMLVNDSDLIVITAVDAHGFESPFSNTVVYKVIPDRTADILYITTSRIPISLPQTRWEPRIDSIMGGVGLTYEILVVYPSFIQQFWYVSLTFADIVGYKWVLLDDDPMGLINMDWYEALARYIQSGGNLACFSYRGLNQPGGESYWSESTLPSELGFELGDYYDIDSAFYAGVDFYETPAPTIDTICGFESARSIDRQLPSVSYDTSVSDSGSDWTPVVWPRGTPSSIAVYAPGDRSTTTHLFQSLYPDKSLMHGLPNGLKTITEDEYGTHLTYTFGFHLHQMKVEEAKQFVIALVEAPECCGRYTDGMAGNIDCDEDGRMDLIDIISLIDRIYLSKRLLCCEKNGNVNGDALKKVNLADITKLIDHVYISKAETAPCE